MGGSAARGSISGSIDSATEWVECRCTTARAAPRVRYSAECSGTSLVGASPEINLPSGDSRDSRAGSSEPSDALVGVTMKPPSSSLTLMFPDEPGVSPRSNNERPRRQIFSRRLMSAMAQIPFSEGLSHALGARPSRDTQRQSRQSAEEEFRGSATCLNPENQASP